VVLAVLVLLGIAAKSCKLSFTDRHDPGHMAATGPATWEIDGKPYSIGSTYFQVLDPGAREQLQFTIDYLISDPAILDGIDEERAARIAMPVMRYAWQHRLFERTSVSLMLQGKELKPSLIGVAITYRQGDSSRGYRVHRSIEEIAKQN